MPLRRVRAGGVATSRLDGLLLVHLRGAGTFYLQILPCGIALSDLISLTFAIFLHGCRGTRCSDISSTQNSRAVLNTTFSHLFSLHI